MIRHPEAVVVVLLLLLVEQIPNPVQKSQVYILEWFKTPLGMRADDLNIIYLNNMYFYWRCAVLSYIKTHLNIQMFAGWKADNPLTQSPYFSDTQSDTICGWYYTEAHTHESAGSDEETHSPSLKPLIPVTQQSINNKMYLYATETFIWTGILVDSF